MYNNIYAKVTTINSSTQFTLDKTIGTLSNQKIYKVVGIAYDNSSHSEGYKNIASGTYSHAEGNVTIASGSNSHAEGASTTASGA